ncbi:DUF397 domain-containing protein [Streptomyces sp. NPDC048290]|uniref:DUF397 domain-containing protein n=1 Tax=Streptomyces sp. NPDC048290 TaxID=3155811 RepID=UPI00342503A9
MMRHDLPVSLWSKSSYSGDTHDQCLETQPTRNGLIAVGDSKARALGAFTFPSAAWEMFIQGIKNDLV